MKLIFLSIQLSHRNVLQACLALTIMCGISTAAFSQKMGHFNSSTIVADLPEIKVADIQIQDLNDSLANEFSRKMQALQQKFQEQQEKYSQGLLSQKEIQTITEELQKEQEALKQQESQFQFIIIQRRQSLYAPTFAKIDSVINELVEEEGYNVIFDSSQPGFIFLSPETDISEKVRSRMED